MERSQMIALVLASAFAVAGCGGGGGGNPAGPSNPGTGGGGAAPPTTVTITITGQGGRLAFNPNPATVSPGQLVVFKNNDTVAHRVTLDDASVQTPEIPPGATSAPVAMGINGSKTYHCTIHPGMVGGFNGAEAEIPPNCNQAYCVGGGD
jgi:plastocyanin